MVRYKIPNLVSLLPGHSHSSYCLLTECSSGRGRHGEIRHLQCGAVHPDVAHSPKKKNKQNKTKTKPVWLGSCAASHMVDGNSEHRKPWRCFLGSEQWLNLDRQQYCTAVPLFHDFTTWCLDTLLNVNATSPGLPLYYCIP